MPNDYRIISTQPYTYLDETNNVVDGYRVFFNITEFEEAHFVNVPTLAPVTVQKEIKAVIADRKTISTQ